MKLKKRSLLSKVWFNFRKNRFIKRNIKRYLYPQLTKLFFESLWQTNFAAEQLYVAPERVAANLPIVLVIGEGQSGKSSLISGSRHILPQSTYLNSDYQPMSGRHMPRFYASPQRLYVELPQYFLINESAKEIPYLDQWLLCWKHSGELFKVHQVILTMSVESLCTKPVQEEFWNSIKLILDKLPKPIQVYFVVTQIDRLQGFSEFFSDLGIEERQHPFGFFLAQKTSLSNQVNEQFLALVKRLQRRMWWRCQSEHVLLRRLMMAEFPKQLASMNRLLLNYLDPFITGIQHHPDVHVKACFFTSTMQQGQVFDLLFDQQEALFTLSEESPNFPMLVQNKEYFVRGFFQQLFGGFTRSEETVNKSKIPKVSKTFWRDFSLIFAGITLLTIILLGGIFSFAWWRLDNAITHQKALAYKILASAYADQNLQQFVEYEAPFLPKSLQTIILRSQDLRHLVNENAKIFLEAHWQNEVYDYYARNIKGKYPIDSNATQEINLNQFNIFYGPTGILAQYDQRYLQPLPVQVLFEDDKSLIDLYTNLKKLHQIFYGNTLQPHISYTAYPDTVAEGVKSASFMVSGIKMDLRRNSLIARTFTWPNQAVTQESGFAVEYLQTLPKIQVLSGTWSWLKLFGLMHWQKNGAENNYKLSTPNAEFILSIEAETPIAELPRVFAHLSVPGVL